MWCIDWAEVLGRVAYFSLGIAMSCYILSRSNKKSTRTFYGMDLYEYNELSHSQQVKVQNEWYMDNNKEDIEYVRSIEDLIDNSPNTITDQQIEQHCTKLEKLYRKYDVWNLRRLKVDLEVIKQLRKEKAEKPKEIVNE